MQTMLSGLFIDFNEVWWNICRGILYIVDILEQAMEFVMGVTPLGLDESGNQSSDDLLTRIFGNLFWDGKVGISGVYWYMLALALMLMIVFILVSIVRAQFTKESYEAVSKIIGKSVVAVFKMLLIPIFFFVGLRLVGIIFQEIVKIMGTIGDSMEVGKGGIAQKIVEACCMDESPIIRFDDNYSKFQAHGGTPDNFSFVMCIAASAFCVVTLVTSSISLIKRILQVFFYYVSAPFTLSRSMLDEGKSFDLWKENVMAKLLGAAGIIICLYLFYAILPRFISIVDTQSTPGTYLVDSWTVRQTLKILFIIGGSTVPATGTMMMAQLVSQGAGQNEANELSHAQQMMGNAFRTAAAVGSKVMAGAMMSGGATAGGALAGQMLAGGLLGGGGTDGGSGTGGFSAQGGGRGGAGGFSAQGSGNGGVLNMAGSNLANSKLASAMMATGGGQGGGVSFMNGEQGAFQGGGAASSMATGNQFEGGGLQQPKTGTGGGFMSNLGANAKQALRSGAMNPYAAQSLAYLGLGGVVGALAARGGRVLKNLIKAPIKAAKQAWDNGTTRSGNTRLGERQLRRARAETERVGRRELRQLGRSERGQEPSIEAAGNRQRAYMNKQLDNYQKQANQVEEHIKKEGVGWSDAKKDAYRHSMLDGAYTQLAGRMIGSENRGTERGLGTSEAHREGMVAMRNRFDELNPNTYRGQQPQPKGDKQNA